MTSASGCLDIASDMCLYTVEQKGQMSKVIINNYFCSCLRAGNTNASPTWDEDLLVPPVEVLL